jgi:hypothetical protein
MRPRSAQVAEKLGVGAAGVLQSVGEEWKAVEVTGVVHSRSKPAHVATVPFQEGPIESDGAEKLIPEDVSEQQALGGLFSP